MRPTKIANVHGAPALAGIPMMVGVAVLALLVAYGLLRYTGWGYSLAVVYLLYLLICVPAIVGRDASPFGNFVWPLVVLIYLAIRKTHYFTRNRHAP